MIARFLFLFLFFNLPVSSSPDAAETPKPSEVNKLITNINKDIRRINLKIDSLLLTRGCILGDSCEVGDIK